MTPSLSHEGIWSAIDALAERLALTRSALARRAGLDPTIFNPSKRLSADVAGRPRWLSTESIAKVLDVTGVSFAEFAALAQGDAEPAPTVPLPLIDLTRAGEEGLFDRLGRPVGRGWSCADFPRLSDGSAYALEISCESMAPAFRPGDRIIVSPVAPARGGDRVVVKTVGGEVMARELGRRSRRLVELRSLNPEKSDRILPWAEIEWIARILWVSQ